MRKQWLLIGASLLLTFGMVACDSKESMDSSNPIESNLAEGEESSLSDNTEDADSDIETDETGNMNEETFEPVEIMAGGWDVVIENTMRDDSLENVSVVLGYTDAATSEFRQEAKEGYEYFLINLTISKGDSKESIDWSKMTLLDKQGNTYGRVEDTFIDELGMNRMPGTALNFGTHEGWIAYEVNEEAEGLTLKYEFENENLEYTFVD